MGTNTAAAATYLLAGGGKAFFENPGYLLGIPLVALGVAVVLLALSPVEVLRWPERRAVEPQAVVELLPPPEGHPTAMVYIQVGVILAIVTAVEVVFYYIDLADGLLLAVLMVLSALKFVMVVLWFMHLRYDSRLLSIAFAGGLVLVAALFFVVLATLGASLV